MKKFLAIIIAVILLAAMTPVAFAADTTVFFSASVNGVLEVAAQPITVSEPTVDAVLKAAHAQFFEGGESSYVASDDPMWGYFITEAWGIATTPYVVLNNAPLGADPAVPASANQAPVANGDNIVLCTSSDSSKSPVALTATVSGNTATVTAVTWLFDFATFSYSTSPFANAEVTDPITGASLGTTDADGVITLFAGERHSSSGRHGSHLYVPEPVPRAPESSWRSLRGGALLWKSLLWRSLRCRVEGALWKDPVEEPPPSPKPSGAMGSSQTGGVSHLQ